MARVHERKYSAGAYIGENAAALGWPLSRAPRRTDLHHQMIPIVSAGTHPTFPSSSTISAQAPVR